LHAEIRALTTAVESIAKATEIFGRQIEIVGERTEPPTSLVSALLLLWSLVLLWIMARGVGSLSPDSRSAVYLSLAAAMFGGLFGWRIGQYAQTFSAIQRRWSEHHKKRPRTSATV
jgi:hypothetical protein